MVAFFLESIILVTEALESGESSTELLAKIGILSRELIVLADEDLDFLLEPLDLFSELPDEILLFDDPFLTLTKLLFQTLDLVTKMLFLILALLQCTDKLFYFLPETLPLLTAFSKSRPKIRHLFF